MGIPPSRRPMFASSIAIASMCEYRFAFVITPPPIRLSLGSPRISCETRYRGRLPVILVALDAPLEIPEPGFRSNLGLVEIEDLLALAKCQVTAKPTHNGTAFSSRWLFQVTGSTRSITSPQAKAPAITTSDARMKAALNEPVLSTIQPVTAGPMIPAMLARQF